MYISGIHTYEGFYGHSIIEPSQSSPQQEVLPAGRTQDAPVLSVQESVFEGAASGWSPAEPDDRQQKSSEEGQTVGNGIAQRNIAWALSGLRKDRALVQYQIFVGTETLSGKENCKEEHFCL